MSRVLLCLILLLCTASRSHAAVVIQLDGEEPVQITSAYLREGTVFLPLREVLPPLHLSGVWDGAKHLYRITASKGEILLAPGSRKLRYAKHLIPLKEAPRFFAGELCVPEEVVATHLPRLLDLELTYSNQDIVPVQKEGIPEDEQAVDLETLLPLQQIVIDPGHGGDDPGAISPEGIKEKDLTLALALRLEKILKMEGVASIHLTRDGDYAVTSLRRVVAARGAAEGNLLLSLHVSAWRSSQTHGCTLYYLPSSEYEEDNSLLAQSLDAALQGAGVADCSLERVALSPLNRTQFPALLLELGYLTNPDELALLGSTDGQERIARALALGVKNYAAKRSRRRTDVSVTQ